MKKNKLEKIVTIFLFIIIALGMYFYEDKQIDNDISYNRISYEMSNIPEYNGEIYVQINDNVPQFTAEDMELEADYYSELENGKVRNGYYKN